MKISVYRNNPKYQYNYGFAFRVISSLAWKDIKIRYKNSALGIIWSILNPLIFLLIFVLVFSQAFSNIKNYPLFALTGLIYWNFFSTTSSQILSSVLAASGILKSLAIPAVWFSLAALLASLINLALSLIPFIGIMIILGGSFNISLIWIIPYTLIFSLFVLGFSLILAALNVYFRDIGMLWSTLLPAVLYLTPIAYPATLVPAETRWLLKFNPLFYYIEAIRNILYTGNTPDLNLALTNFFIAIVFLAVGLTIFRKLEKHFISAL